MKIIVSCSPTDGANVQHKHVGINAHTESNTTRYYFISSAWSLPPSRLCLLVLLLQQETPTRTEKGAGAQETAHQEAAQRLHALHERDARQRGGRVHAEGERRHQPDPRTKGRRLGLLSRDGTIGKSHITILVVQNITTYDIITILACRL